MHDLVCWRMYRQWFLKNSSVAISCLLMHFIGECRIMSAHVIYIIFFSKKNQSTHTKNSPMESLHFETSVFEHYKNDHKNGKSFEKTFSKNFMRSTNEIYFSFASLPSSHRNEYWHFYKRNFCIFFSNLLYYAFSTSQVWRCFLKCSSTTWPLIFLTAVLLHLNKVSFSCILELTHQLDVLLTNSEQVH